MLIEHGPCRSCEGQLDVTGADDATVDIECTDYGDG